MPYKDPIAQRKFIKEWKAIRRAEWLRENGPCPCGSWEQLEIHHKDPSKKITHRVWTWTKEKRDKELAKCEVLCDKCHQIKTTRYRRIKAGMQV